MLSHPILLLYAKSAVKFVGSMKSAIGRFVMWSLQKLVCFSVLFAQVLKYFCIFAHVLRHV